MDTNILTIDHNNGHKSEYILIPDGGDLPIAYNLGTSPELIEILERHRKQKTRLRFHWGDPETGEDWGEIFDVSGHIGLSRGHQARFPLLIHNKRSMGGGAISTDRIVKITYSKGKAPIYTHPKYHLDVK